jgi:hypothetical protein
MQKTFTMALKTFLLSFSLFLTLLRTTGQRITYASVAPIFLSKCASCHRPGEAAPFSLLAYEDIAKRAPFIKKVVEANYMPPWRADAHYRDFANNRTLSPGEKDMILRWIDAGAPKGPGSADKRQPALLTSTAYHRPPDLTLKIDSAFPVPGDDAERFIEFKLPYELPEGRNIEAVEFYCNNKKIIHHINYGFYDVPDSSVDIFGGSKFMDAGNAGARLNEYDPLKKNFIYYTGWIPGASYESYPAGFGWTLPKRGVVILTVHYSALGADEKSIVGVNLFFSQKPVERQVKIISFGSGGIGENDITPSFMIRPGQVDTFHLRLRSQEDQSLLYVWPHMHYIGKEFTAFAVTPAGDTVPLVHIPRWDFRWQELYRFKHLVKIPAGSVINVTGIYDNTAENPANPNNPPRLVFSTGNMDSRNEMLTLMLIYVSSKENDEKVSL